MNSAIYPGFQRIHQSSRFWKWANCVIALTSVVGLLFQYWLYTQGAKPAIVFCLVYFWSFAHCSRMFFFYSRRVEALERSSQVVNEIPAQEGVVEFHLNRMGGSTISIGADLNLNARYELIAASSELLQILQSNPQVMLYFDPVTKLPAAIQAGANTAALRRR